MTADAISAAELDGELLAALLVKFSETVTEYARCFAEIRSRSPFGAPYSHRKVYEPMSDVEVRSELERLQNEIARLFAIAVDYPALEQESA